MALPLNVLVQQLGVAVTNIEQTPYSESSTLVSLASQIKTLSDQISEGFRTSTKPISNFNLINDYAALVVRYQTFQQKLRESLA